MGASSELSWDETDVWVELDFSIFHNGEQHGDEFFLINQPLKHCQKECFRNFEDCIFFSNLKENY